MPGEEAGGKTKSALPQFLHVEFTSCLVSSAPTPDPTLHGPRLAPDSVPTPPSPPSWGSHQHQRGLQENPRPVPDQPVRTEATSTDKPCDPRCHREGTLPSPFSAVPSVIQTSSVLSGASRGGNSPLLAQGKGLPSQLPGFGALVPWVGHLVLWAQFPHL